MSLLRALRVALGRRRWGKWVLLVALALVLTGLEIVGAGLVFMLLNLVTDPSAEIDLPVIGDPTRLMAGASSQQLVILLCAMVGVFFIVRGVLLVIGTYAQARVVNNAGADIGTRLVRGYLRMPYALHLERNSAELIRNAFHNVVTVTNQLLDPAVKLVAEALIMLGLCGALFWIAPLPTLTAVVVFTPAVWLLMRAVKPRMRGYGRIAKEEQTRGLNVLQEGLMGIRELRVFGSEAQFTSVYRRTRQRYANVRTYHSAFSQVPRVMIETMLVLFVAGFFVALIQFQETPQGALSVLGLFAYVGMRLKPSVQVVVSAVNSIRFAAPCLEDIVADLEMTASFTDDRSPTGGELVPRLQHTIRLDGVRYWYPRSDRPALEGIDLRIQRGEAVGICGSTGGGKSTLVDLIAGLLVPTEGSVLVDGIDIHQDVHAWYRQLGVASQTVVILDDTLKANIALGLRPEDIDEVALQRAVRLAQLETVVRELPDGLDTRLGERGTRLSGGQRQRVALARALYRDPEVLILDEGTAALDNATETHVVEGLRSLHGHRTLIMVAHRLTTLRHCDRILIVEDGRITDEGGFDELAQRHPLFLAVRQTTSPR